MRCFLFGRQFSAYIDGELDSTTRQKIEFHLEGCSKCRAKLERIRQGAYFAELLAPVRAPEMLWQKIEPHIQEIRPRAQSTQKKLAPISIVQMKTVTAALVVVIVGLGFWLYQNQRNPLALEVDLNGYLDALENRNEKNTQMEISIAPPSFFSTNEAYALKAARIAAAARKASPVGISLQASRVRTIGRNEVVQLVYGTDQEAFAVFVAPEAVKFLFGPREFTAFEVHGIPCRKVECAQNSVVCFGAKGLHCVLVTKTNNANKIAAIVHYFISAHESLG